MISLSTLELIHPHLLERGYEAFIKEHEYDPRIGGIDRIVPGTIKSEYDKEFNMNYYIFNFCEITRHDMPYGTSVTIYEEDLLELIQKLEIPLDYDYEDKPCKYCDVSSTGSTGENLPLREYNYGDFYISKEPNSFVLNFEVEVEEVLGNRTAVIASETKIKYCPMCARKLK